MASQQVIICAAILMCCMFNIVLGQENSESDTADISGKCFPFILCVVI